MPTNFQVSSAPALRCVTGEPYAVTVSDHASGFFSRLRMAERLVIQAGPQLSIAHRVGEWNGSCAQLERQADFTKNIAHA